MPDHPPLADQADRDRFTRELDQNFSVTAPAGVGKTTSIVNRVIELAKSDHKREEPALPRLSVVTYTRKAADEMRRRTADALHEAEAGPEIFARFHQAFFGTIHSFCLDLIRQYGALAGLAPQVEEAPNEDALWWEFLRGRDHILQALPDEIAEPFTRMAPVHKAYQLVGAIDPHIVKAPIPGPPPEPDLSTLLNYQPGERTRKDVKANIETGQKLAADWLAAYRQPPTPCNLPKFTKGGKEFLDVWAFSWLPIKHWLGDVYLYLATQLAREFREFRVARGQINYDDMVALAAGLLDHPEVGQAIRDEKRIIILDEAQDTDRLQFSLLLNIAGAEWSPDTPLRDAQGPLPGRYCQVGDPQQAIYSSRADLDAYREVHEALVETRAADALSFTVTMRCDEAIVHAVNQFFPNVLRSEEQASGQAAFVPLNARPNAGPGRVERLCLPEEPGFYDQKPRTDERTEAEARALARWLRETGCAGLGETDWSLVSLLTPRKGAWLEAPTNALDREGLPWQAHSGRGNRQDDPAWAWTAAIIHILTHPEDAFQIAGVLREVFALSDDAIARHCLVHEHTDKAGAHPLSLNGDINSDQLVSQTLRLLADLREDIQGESPSDSFRLIINRLQLENRLNALPEQSTDHVNLTLKRLMANAVAVEESGGDLEAWSHQLNQTLTTDPEGDDPKPGYLQILTCHKAKGLQWGVVIVPLIHREIGFFDDNYPRFYSGSQREPAQVAFDHDCSRKAHSKLKTKRIRELERLAYVTWTRAQRRLIFVDGGNFHQDVKPEKLNGSWLDLWNVSNTGLNAQAWDALPDFQPSDQIFESASSKDDSQPEASLLHLPKRRLRQPTATQVNFPNRILPSSLANHDINGAPFSQHARDEHDWRSEPSYEETNSGVEALGGADYGNWWHLLMQIAPWSHLMETWRAHLNQHLPNCPAPERGAAEFASLIASSGFKWLNHPQRQIRTETALLWPEGAIAPQADELELPPSQPPGFAYDGFIDLLAYDHSKQRWRIVDWKTDRIGKDPQGELLKAYGSQLNAYVTALRCMFGAPVEGYLYSTRAAQWIRLPD